MSDSNYTHIVLLLDGSGSMMRLKQDTVKNVNAFIAAQRTENLQNDGRIFSLGSKGTRIEVRCTVDVIVFQGKIPIGGSTIEQLYAARETSANPGEPYHYKRVKIAEDINQGPVTMVDSDYIPYGGTPLMDAFDRAITDTETFILGLGTSDRRPGRVIFVVTTDGEDHESKRVTKAGLCERITRKTNEDNWQFMYVGANHNSFVESKGYGFAGSHTMNFIATSPGISAAYATMASTVAMKRCISDPSLMKHCNFESHTKPKSAVELQDESAVQAGKSSSLPLVVTHGSTTTDEERAEMELFRHATRADAHTGTAASTGHSPNASNAGSGSNAGYSVYDYRSKPGNVGFNNSCSTGWSNKPKRKADQSYFTENVTIAPDPEDVAEMEAKNSQAEVEFARANAQLDTASSEGMPENEQAEVNAS